MTLGFLDRLRQRKAQTIPLEPAGPSQVRAYWEGLRSGGALPSRAALDPRGLGGVLDRVFLAERIGTGLAQVRVAGSALAELAGSELRGLPLSCLFTAESRPLLAAALEEVFVGPAIAEIDLGVDRGRIGSAIARMLLLPLQDEGDCRQLLGVIGFSDGTHACKFQVLARRTERLAPIQPEPVPSPLITEAPIVTDRHSHLRLVHFDA